MIFGILGAAFISMIKIIRRNQKTETAVMEKGLEGKDGIFVLLGLDETRSLVFNRDVSGRLSGDPLLRNVLDR